MKNAYDEVYGIPARFMDQKILLGGERIPCMERQRNNSLQLSSVGVLKFNGM